LQKPDISPNLIAGAAAGTRVAPKRGSKEPSFFTESFMQDMQSEWFVPAAIVDPNKALDLGSDPDHSETITQLNAFLRGEISATETYRMAIDKLIEDECEPGTVAILRELQHEHIRSAQAIRKRIVELGGTCDESSGMWGTWAKIAQGAAQLFGDSAALHSLKEGEEHALRDMRAGLKNLDAQSTELIENNLIPAQEKNRGRVDYLIDLIGA